MFVYDIEFRVFDTFVVREFVVSMCLFPGQTILNSEKFVALTHL